MVKQLMRDRVRFEPKVSWLHILKREAWAGLDFRQGFTQLCDCEVNRTKATSSP